MVSLVQSTSTHWRETVASRRDAFVASTSGLAAVEFAMILPAMVAIWFATMELVTGYTVSRKITQLSRTVSDLASRANQNQLDKTSTGQIFNAAVNVLYPYVDLNATPKKTLGLKIVLSSIYIEEKNGSKQAKVCWSVTNKTDDFTDIGDSGQTTFTDPIPTGFDAAGTSFLYSVVTSNYKPEMGATLAGDGFDIGEKTPWPVRNAQQITYKVSSTVTKSCDIAPT